MRKLACISIAVFFFVSACTKIESTTIGGGLIPPIDGVATLDTTLDVFTNNYLDFRSDSARVYYSDDHVIGIINNDPLFGTTKATTYFELKPTYYKYSFPGGTSLTPDSAVLILSYKGVYGDTTVSQNWEVRELTETLRGDTAYPVSKPFSTGSVLGTKTIDIPHLKDSVNYGFENAAMQIRIKLSASFAQKLMKQYDSTAGNAYETDSLFREHFKGFAVVPGSAGNALIRVNLADTNTKLALFYNYQSPDSGAGKVTSSVSYFRFSVGTGSAVSGNANCIQRNHNSTQLTQYFTNTSRNDSLVFLQTMPGTFTTVKIPALRTLPNIIIHKAELMTFQAPDITPAFDMIFTPPRYLLLSIYDSSKSVKNNIPNDFVVSSGTPNTSAFGGYLMDKEVPPYGIVKAYSFDVSRYVQGIVTRRDSSYILRLSAPSNDSLIYVAPYPATTVAAAFYVIPSIANNVGEGRVRLGGGGMNPSNQLRMRLRIVYSKL